MGKLIKSFGTGIVFFMILMFQVASGFSAVVISGVIDPVLINEFGVPATLVGILLGIHYLAEPIRTYIGSLSDRFSIFGLHRTPFVMLGGIILAATYPAMVLVIEQLRDPNYHRVGEHLGNTGNYPLNPLWLLVAVIIFFINGTGISILGTTSLALVVDVTNERVRGVVAAISWTFLIGGFIVGSIISVQIVPATEGFTFVASSLYPMFMIVVPAVILSLSLISTIGCFIKEPRHHGAIDRDRTHVSLKQAFKAVSSNRQTRWFFTFIAVMMTFMFMRDLLAPAYAGNVFKMTVKERSALLGVIYAPIFIAMLGTGILTLWIPKKLMAYVGLFISAAGIAIQSGSAMLLQIDKGAVSAYQAASKAFADKAISQAEFDTALKVWNTQISDSKGIFTVGLIIMGIGLGICVPGLIGMMMDLTDKANAAFYIGVWGIGSALGQLLSNVLAGIMRDTAINVFTENLAFGYGLVFAVQGLGMLSAAWILTHVDIAEFKRKLHATSPVATPQPVVTAEVPGSGVVWYDSADGYKAGTNTPAHKPD